MSESILGVRGGEGESLVDAFHKRQGYGGNDDILADVRSGDHIMGDVFATAVQPELHVKLAGTKPFAKVLVIKDGRYVYTAEPKTAAVVFKLRSNEALTRESSLQLRLCRAVDRGDF